MLRKGVVFSRYQACVNHSYFTLGDGPKANFTTSFLHKQICSKHDKKRDDGMEKKVVQECQPYFKSSR